MTIFWPAFIGGLVCVVLGVVVLVNKARLADVNAGAQRAMLRKAGERVAQASTPRRMMSTGVGIIVVGLIGITLSLLNLDW
jgi:hypothetical protein